jgi:hypothetical protein
MTSRSQIRGLKLVVGEGRSTRNACMAMALRIGAHIRAVGCKVNSTRLSRNTRSNSVYIHFTSSADKIWVVRISDHHRPDRSEIPNFDLISRDGVRGEEWLRDCISSAAVGGVQWFDSAETGRMPSAKEQKLIGKSKCKSRFTGRAARHLPK